MNNPVPPTRVVVLDVDHFFAEMTAREDAFFRRLRSDFLHQQAEETAERYLSREETASMLKVTFQTLSKYVRDMGLKKVKIGNRVVFRLSDIEAWLKEHETRKAVEHIPYRTEQAQAEHDWMVKAHIKAPDW